MLGHCKYFCILMNVLTLLCFCLVPGKCIRGALFRSGRSTPFFSHSGNLLIDSGDTPFSIHRYYLTEEAKSPINLHLVDNPPPLLQYYFIGQNNPAVGDKESISEQKQHLLKSLAARDLLAPERPPMHVALLKSSPAAVTVLRNNEQQANVFKRRYPGLKPKQRRQDQQKILIINPLWAPLPIQD